MHELDFHGLRAEVEAVTTLPGFADVQQRARRLRRRSRLTMSTAMLATLAVVLPAGMLASQARHTDTPTHLTVGPAPGPDDTDPGPDPTPTPTVPPRVTTVAAGGVDITHVWMAVDVCRAESCNLQLSAVRADRQPDGPARIGQLRRAPTDKLTDVTVTALGPASVVLSAVIPGVGRQYTQLSRPGSGPDGPAAATTRHTAEAGQVVVQLKEHGDLQVADPATGRLTLLPEQPPLDDPQVVPGIDPSHGVWVTGRTGSTAALAYSGDGGATWRIRQLDSAAGGTSTVLTTADGRTAYLFASSPTGLRQWRTGDGGGTWTPVPVRMPWPSTASGVFGAVVRPDGSLLVWQDGPPAPIFLESTDSGASFHPVSGPSGPVVMVPGGYVALGERTYLSRDARTWAPEPVPYLPVTN